MKKTLIVSTQWALMVAVVFTTATAFATSYFFPGETDALVFAVAISASLSIVGAFPTFAYFYHQHLKITELNERLKQTNEELRMMYTHSKRDASVDNMTKLLNREHFFAAVRNRRRSIDYGSLLILDIDHFKSINDTYGHQVGDKALQSVAETMLFTLRDSDVLGRIGGEEFAAFLPSPKLEDAITAAERLRINIEALRIEVDEETSFSITASIGVGLAPKNDVMEDIFQRVDEALYVAKRSGRNRTQTVEAAPIQNNNDDQPVPFSQAS